MASSGAPAPRRTRLLPPFIALLPLSFPTRSSSIIASRSSIPSSSAVATLASPLPPLPSTFDVRADTSGSCQRGDGDGIRRETPPRPSRHPRRSPIERFSRGRRRRPRVAPLPRPARRRLQRPVRRRDQGLAQASEGPHGELVPDTPPERVRDLLAAAWAHNALAALKLACNLRGVRGTGKSDKEGFYAAALSMHSNHPETLACNVAALAEFGYLKDFPELLFRLIHGSDVRKAAKERGLASRKRARELAPRPWRSSPRRRRCRWIRRRRSIA